jgi:hypothetical protein
VIRGYADGVVDRTNVNMHPASPVLPALGSGHGHHRGAPAPDCHSSAGQRRPYWS